MRERRGVEVEFRVMFLSPLNPALEIFRSHLVAIDDLALEVSVNLVKIETVCPRNEALGLEYVGAELVDVACGSRIVAGCLDASRESAGLHLEALHVVCLPAVHAEMEILKLREHLFRVDSKFGIAFLGDFVCLVYEFLFHIFMFYICFMSVFQISRLHFASIPSKRA